jgi:hypothetical protein
MGPVPWTSAKLSAPAACSLENFRVIDFYLSLCGFILCLQSLQALPDASFSVSVSLEQFYPSLLLNPLSPFDLRSFWYYPYRGFLLPIPSISIFHQYQSSIDTDLRSIPPSIPIFHSIYDPFDTHSDTRYSYWVDPSIRFEATHRFEQKISSFPGQFFLFFTVLFTGKPNLEEKARFCKLYDNSRFDSRVSRLRNFLLTRILLYSGFTFEVPEHQSYILYLRVHYRVYCTILYQWPRCKSEGPIFAIPRLYVITALFSSSCIYIIIY